jgi:hypothetical protein
LGGYSNKKKDGVMPGFGGKERCNVSIDPEGRKASDDENGLTAI